MMANTLHSRDRDRLAPVLNTAEKLRHAESYYRRHSRHNQRDLYLMRQEAATSEEVTP